MGRRRLAIGFVVLGALGWQVWGRGGSVDAREVSAPSREPVRDARVLPVVVERVATPPKLELVEDGDPDAAEAEPRDDDGLTIEERWAGTVAELEDRLARGRGAVQGRIRDLQTNEPLAGVTIALTAAHQVNPLVAITDGDGFYELSDLVPGDYLATFYYADVTYERSVSVTAREATPVFVSLGRPLVDRDSREDRMPDKEELARQGISFTGVESLNNTYYVDSIDTTGLYFGEPDGASDALGVSMAGTTTLENQYVIDGEDHVEIEETE